MPFTFKDERKTIIDELILSANITCKADVDQLLVS